jgi:hypothetical protein
MRGGIDELGWDGSLKQAIETYRPFSQQISKMLTIPDRVTSFVQYQTKVETPTSSPNPTAMPTKVPVLEYPSHPFSPEISVTIAKLPRGFSNVALQRTLSLQTIDLLLDTHEQDLAHRNRPPVDAPWIAGRQRLYTADKALELLKAQDMPTTERMIIGGLLAYTVQAHHVYHPDRTTSPIYIEPLRNFIAEIAQYVFVNYEHPVLLWVVLCFAAIQSHITEGGMRVDFFHHTILRFKQSPKWSQVDKAVREFCWTEERILEWKWAWEDAVGSHKPQGYAQSMTSGTSSRGPSMTPEVEGTTIAGSVRTPYLGEEEARHAKLYALQEDEMGLGVKMEG